MMRGLAFNCKQELETAVVLVVAPHDLLVADPRRAPVELLEVRFPASDYAFPLLRPGQKSQRRSVGDRKNQKMRGGVGEGRDGIGKGGVRRAAWAYLKMQT